MYVHRDFIFPVAIWAQTFVKGDRLGEMAAQLSLDHLWSLPNAEPPEQVAPVQDSLACHNAACPGQDWNFRTMETSGRKLLTLIRHLFALLCCWRAIGLMIIRKQAPYAIIYSAISKFNFKHKVSEHTEALIIFR